MDVRVSKWAIFIAFLLLYYFLAAKEEVDVVDSQGDAFMFISGEGIQVARTTDNSIYWGESGGDNRFSCQHLGGKRSLGNKSDLWTKTRQVKMKSRYKVVSQVSHSK